MLGGTLSSVETPTSWSAWTWVECSCWTDSSLELTDISAHDTFLRMVTFAAYKSSSFRLSKEELDEIPACF